MAFTSCGGYGSGGGSNSTSQSHGSSAAQSQINSREEAALPKDPNFVGDPHIDVRCSNSSCKATLSSALATNIPLAVDHWTVAGGSPKLNGGSNVVGFMAADADFQCMNHFADTGSVRALQPCSRVVAHKHLP
jgi:hypothetical protein